MDQNAYKKYIIRSILLLSIVGSTCVGMVFYALTIKRWSIILCIGLPLLFAFSLGVYHLRATMLQVNSFRNALLEDLDDDELIKYMGKIKGKLSIPSYYHIIILLLEHIKNKYSKILLNREAKLNVLQSQINPHFLYNTLDSIRSDIQEAGLEKPAEMLEELANFFRYSISDKEIVISLRKELENVDTYMNIMRFRFGSRFTLVKYVDTHDSFLMDFKMPKMVLQPLIENAINHGLEPRYGEGLIILHISHTDQFIEIIIQDNGVGMEQEQLNRIRDSLKSKNSLPLSSSKGGLALGNVDKRLKLFFGDTYGLSILSAEGLGTEIKILMPLSGGTLYGLED